MISLLIGLVFVLGSEQTDDFHFAEELAKAGYSADALGVMLALEAAFQDNNAALLYLAIGQASRTTKDTKKYVEFLYEQLAQHADDDFKRNVSLAVLAEVSAVPGKYRSQSFLACYRLAVRALDGEHNWDNNRAYRMLTEVSGYYSLGMCKYATRHLLSQAKRGLYPAVEAKACKELTNNCWDSLSPEVAYLIFSVRKGGRIFPRFKEQFEKKAAPYLDGTTKPAMDLREKVIAQLDEEIAKDGKLLEEMVQKEEAAKAVPAK